MLENMTISSCGVIIASCIRPLTVDTKYMASGIGLTTFCAMVEAERDGIAKSTDKMHLNPTMLAAFISNISHNILYSKYNPYFEPLEILNN